MYFKFLFDSLYPPICLICKIDCFNANMLCSDCWNKISFITRPYCKKCGKSLNDHSAINLCTEDKCFYNKHLYNSIRSVTQYDEFVKKLIVEFKLQAKFKLTKIFHNWFQLLCSGDEQLNKIDYIIPVPMHSKKLKKRGYNQSIILSEIISKIMNKKVMYNVLLKKLDGPNQSELKKNMREKNLVDAFSIANFELIKDKNILLVDDVVTTGSTINECSKVLLLSGSKEVNAISIARR
ncbi:MAG: ComF family protein [Candidatus Midichloriaceae bacterium]|jgi:ComF family protein